MTVDYSQALSDVILEVRAAEAKHPEWYADGLHSLGIINEELGEAFKHAIDCAYHGDMDTAQVRREVVQVGATVLRFLANWDEMYFNPSPATKQKTEES